VEDFIILMLALQFLPPQKGVSEKDTLCDFIPGRLDLFASISLIAESSN